MLQEPELALDGGAAAVEVAPFVRPRGMLDQRTKKAGGGGS